MEELNHYMLKAIDLEEQGYVEEAIKLCLKCMQEFSDYNNEINLELAKMCYRNQKTEEAFVRFLSVYQNTGEQEIIDLIFEAFYFSQREELNRCFQENCRQLEEYDFYFRDMKKEKDIHYIPLLVGENVIWYYDIFEGEFKTAQRCAVEMYKPDDKVYIAGNLLWKQDILLLEKMTKKINPFMDEENALFLVYQNDMWELFLQLFEVKEFINLDRIFFFDGIDTLADLFYKDKIGFIIPSKIVGGLHNEIKDILDSYWTHYFLEKESIQEKIIQYYESNDANVIKHIRGGTPNILFVTSRFTSVLQFQIRDCKEAAERIGCETRLLIEQGRFDRGLSSLRCLKIIENLKPDIVFLINCLRNEDDILNSLHKVVFITWIQDLNPNKPIMKQQYIDRMISRDVLISLFISDLNGEKSGIHYTDVLKAPVVVNENLYKKWILSDQEIDQYSCDICIVANETDYKGKINGFFNQIPENMKDSCKYVLDLYIDMMEQEQFFYGHYENFQAVCMIASKLNFEWLNTDFTKKFSDFIYYTIYYRRYKSLVAEWLIDSGYTNIKLYGNQWEKDEKFKPYAMGIIENGEKLSKALGAAKISIGLHPHVSLPSKAVESIASGSFYLAHHIKEEFDLANAREYFKENEEIVYYYDKQDLINKIDYFLKNKEEREKIIKAGQKRIAAELTYEKMLSRIFQESAELIERRENNVLFS